MRRLAAILLFALAVTGATFAAGAGDSDEGYKVRAIFNSAFSLVAGEDVKVAGVRVGKIESLDVTDDNKAAVVLDIEDPGFRDFRADATCTIRPQSLIGEKFVECTLEEPKAPGSPRRPPLQRQDDGEHLLPVENTRAPIDLDLVNNTLRLPYRERLAIILNELGVGLAGRGEDLDQAIRNANPALRDTGKVLRILASQNEVLKDLASDGDRILRPLARERDKVADFVTQAATVAKATAERRADLELNIQKLPAFLRELRPTMRRLGALSDEMTPVLDDVGEIAPDLSRFVLSLGPFSRSANRSLTTLGEAAEVGRVALTRSKPIVDDLRTFAAEGDPLFSNLRDTLVSLRDTGGIERAMDYIFYQVAAVNGYDSIGHYLRAILVVNICSTYATQPDSACISKFTGDDAKARTAAQQLADGRSPALVRTDQVLRGADPDEVLGRDKAKAGKRRRSGDDGPALKLPPAFLPGQTAPESKPAAPAPATPAPQPEDERDGAVKALLDYLLGDPLSP